jgi:hypothetical protein
VATIPSHRDTLEDMKRKSAERIAKYDREADERLARDRQRTDTLLEDSRRRKAEAAEREALRRELQRREQIARRRADDRLAIGYNRQEISFLKALGQPLPPRLMRVELEEKVESWADPNDPRLLALRDWLLDVERREHLDVRECVDRYRMNGAAIRDFKYCYVPPVTSVQNAVIRGHEYAHLLHPPLADYRRINTEDGGSVSVPAEIAATEWLLAHVPVWDEEMHAFMARCLRSYTPYATETEATQIDRLTGRLSYCLVKQRLLERTL